VWPFTRSNPVRELIPELNFEDLAIHKLEKEIDAFERANPLVGALGDAVGFVAVGGKNPALQTRLQRLDQLKSALAKAREQQQERRDRAAARLDEFAAGDPSRAVRSAARRALDKARKPARGAGAKTEISEVGQKTESAKQMLEQGIRSHDVDKIQSALSLNPGLANTRYDMKTGRHPRYPKYRDLTPLHLAALDDRTDVIEILLRCGARPDSRDERGRSPLHLTRWSETARLLVKSGANINLRDKDGRTPLNDALAQCIQGPGPPVEMRGKFYAEALVKLGADPGIPDKQGVTPRLRVQRSLGTHPDYTLQKIAELIGVKKA